MQSPRWSSCCAPATSPSRRSVDPAEAEVGGGDQPGAEVLAAVGCLGLVEELPGCGPASAHRERTRCQCAAVIGRRHQRERLDLGFEPNGGFDAAPRYALGDAGATAGHRR